jgi:hypothetical protein
LLIKAIELAYSGAEPPPLLRLLARFDVPGIVYMPFVGLAEVAFSGRPKSPQTITGIEQQSSSDITGTVLMCPKGTLRQKNSLILTEEDHELLYERLSRLSPVLRDHLRGGVGRSALFVGVSPRDELARRVASQVLEAGENRIQGPTFFVAGYHSMADDAYWDKYRVRWISCDIARFASDLSRIVQ